MTCKHCSVELTGRTPTKSRPRLFCSVRCGTYHRRLARRKAAQAARPRCMICSAPLPYGKPGFNLSSTTCSVACHVKRNNWFVRPSTNSSYHSHNVQGVGSARRQATTQSVHREGINP